MGARFRLGHGLIKGFGEDVACRIADELVFDDVRPASEMLFGTHEGYSVCCKELNLSLTPDQNEYFVLDVVQEPYLNSIYNVPRLHTTAEFREPRPPMPQNHLDVRKFFVPNSGSAQSQRLLDSDTYAEFKKNPREFISSGKMTKKVFTCKLLEELIITPRKGLYQYPPQNYHFVSPYGGGKTGAAIEYIIRHHHLGIIYVTDDVEEWETRVQPALREHGINCELNVFKRAADVNAMDMWHYLMFDQADPEFWCLRWSLVFLDINVMPMIIPVIRYEYLHTIETFLNHMGLTYGIHGYERHDDDVKREAEVKEYNTHKHKVNRITFKNEYETYDPDVNCNMARFMDYIVQTLTWDDIIGIESWSSEEGARIFENLKKIQPQTGIVGNDYDTYMHNYIDPKHMLKSIAYSLAHKLVIISTPPFMLGKKKHDIALCIHPMNIYFNHMYQTNLWLCSGYGIDFSTEMFAPFSQRYYVGADKYMHNVIGYINLDEFVAKRWKKSGLYISKFQNTLSSAKRLEAMKREARLKLLDAKRKEAIELGQQPPSDDPNRVRISVPAYVEYPQVEWADHWPSDAIDSILDRIMLEGKAPSNLLHTSSDDLMDSMMQKVSLNGYRYVRLVIHNDKYKKLFSDWLERKLSTMPYETRPEYEIVNYECARKAFNQDSVPRLVICVGMPTPDMDHGGFMRLLMIDRANKYKAKRDVKTRFRDTVLQICFEQGYYKIKQQWDLGGRHCLDRTDLVIVQGKVETSALLNRFRFSRCKLFDLS